MKKTVVFSILSIVLIGFLMASPLMPLLEKNSGKTYMYGSAEDEKGSKKEEAEKNFDELDLYLKNFYELSFYYPPLHQTICSAGFVFHSLEFTKEILDPPPKDLS